MKRDFPAIWAESPATLRREPTNAEMAGGFPCGDLDLQLFNELFFRLAQMYRELSYAISQSGQTPSANDLTQVWNAMRAASPNFSYGVAGGTSTALTVTSTFPSVRTPYREGAMLLLRLPATLAIGANATINVGPDGLAKPLVRNDRSPVQTGDGPAGTFALFGFYNDAWQMIGNAGAEALKLPAINQTFYVRPDGNNANDGLANTSASAVQTIDAALALTRTYFSTTGTITIKLGVAGTYDWPRNLADYRNDITILGDPAAQANYIISGPGPASGGRAVVEVGAGTVRLSGINIANTAANNFHLAVAGGGSLFLDRTTLSGSVPNNSALLYVAGGSVGSIGTGCIFATPGANMLLVRNGQLGISTGSALTVLGNPTFSDATASALDGGSITVRSGVTITGSAVGRRYNLAGNGIIRTAGLGENFFPGTINGAKEDIGSKYYP